MELMAKKKNSETMSTLPLRVISVWVSVVLAMVDFSNVVLLGNSDWARWLLTRVCVYYNRENTEMTTYMNRIGLEWIISQQTGVLSEKQHIRCFRCSCWFPSPASSFRAFQNITIHPSLPKPNGTGYWIESGVSQSSFAFGGEVYTT